MLRHRAGGRARDPGGAVLIPLRKIRISPAAIAAAALVLGVILAARHGPLPIVLAVVLVLLGAVGFALAVWRTQWEIPLHAAGVALLAVLAWWADHRTWWLALGIVAVIVGTFWVAIERAQRRLRDLESRNEGLAVQLDRRISELFSLQELSYILSESLQLERVVEQVVRYAMRFLQSEGAIVVLADERSGGTLRIAAAAGSLEELRGRVGESAGASLVRLAIDRERIEVSQGVHQTSAHLLDGVVVGSAAVAPLRVQGVTMGALAVADRRGGPYTTEDLWLLSTVATQASVVITNSRLYEMVRRSKDEWETAFNALAEGLAVVEPDGTIVRANRSLARLADVPEADVVGCNFGDLVFGEGSAAQALIEATYRGERTTPVVSRSDRTRRVLRLTAAPIGGDDGERGSVVVLVEDVTEQRALEAQVIQSDKMASIGQLVSGVAHELNNPLTSIAGLSELLLEREALSDPSREHLRVIHDQAERAGRIVRNLLTFARKGEPEERAPVDLNDVVARTSLLIAYELELRGIELESPPSPAPVVVMGDRYELQQVLLNLVTNAVQAVSDLPAGQPRRITLLTERAGDEVRLRVRDSGPGVPPHLVSYLFTPFFTTKAPGQGTGLGLSLSYGLVKAHGGRIDYAPAPGGGAEFTITLPVHEMRGTGAPALAVKGTDGARKTPAEPAPIRRILVVDDDPAVHRLVSALFAPDGNQVEGARSGDLSLRLATSQRFDLVIVDSAATVGPTESFVTALLAARPEWTDRIIVAGTAPTEDRPGLRYVRKPFNIRDLRSLATDILTRRAS